MFSGLSMISLYHLRGKSICIDLLRRTRRRTVRARMAQKREVHAVGARDCPPVFPLPVQGR
jgi:hypothetical protein